MVNKQFFMRVISLSLAAVMLCGCGGKNAGSADADNSGGAAAESGGALETVEVADSDNAGKAPDSGSDGVADQAKADTKADESDIDYEAFYKPVLDEIYSAIISGIEEGNPPSYLPSILEERILYDPDSNILQTVGYHIEDVSGDGIPELLIIDNGASYDGASPNSVVCGVFTKKDGDIFMTIDSWLRSSHYWIGDNRFGYLGSGGAYNTLYGIYRLSEDGTYSEWEDFYFSDEVDGEVKYYTNKTGEWDIDKSEEADMATANEFWNYLEAQSAPQLEITAFETYGSYVNEYADTSEMQSDKISYFKIPNQETGECEADLDGDGKAETIGFKMTQDDFYYVDTLTLNIDGKDYALPKMDEACAFIMDGFNCFWFRPGGDKQYLYAQYVTDSDYTCSVIYSFDGEKFELVDYMDGAVFFSKLDSENKPMNVFPTDPDEFLVRKMDYMLGTQSYTQKCKLGDTGLPEPLEEYRYYLTSSTPAISAAKNIACYLYEDEDATEGQPAVIEQDAMVIPYRTDGATYIDLKVDGASGIYRIMIQTYEYETPELSYSEGMTGSLLLTDCFAGLLFAG